MLHAKIEENMKNNFIGFNHFSENLIEESWTKNQSLTHDWRGADF